MQTPDANELHGVRARGTHPVRLLLCAALLFFGACGTEAEPSARPPAGVTDTSTDDDANLPGPDDATDPGDADDDSAAPDVPGPGDTTPDPDPDDATPDEDTPPDDAADDTEDDLGDDTEPDPTECDEDQTREQTCADGSVGSTCRCDDGRWTCSGDGCRNERCDDGSALACRQLPPTCTTGNIAAIIDGCWRCVNATTCTAIGGGGLPIDGICSSDTQCAPDARCAAPGTPGPPVRRCQPHGCASESAPTCDLARPTCGAGEVSVVRGGCWICVDGTTCTSEDDPGVAECRVDVECGPEAYCDECASASCAECDDCIPGCVDHICPTESVLTCRCARPDCGDASVAIIRDGCWVCVDRGTCRADTDADACGS